MMQPSPFLITNQPGFTPHISRLVSMMNYARRTTLEMVRHLSVSELDLLPDLDGNSVGMLLEHIAAVEVSYQASTFEQRELNEEELARWGVGLELGAQGREVIRGHDIRYYLENLNTVRERTLAAFRQRDDDWLHQEFPFWGGQAGNHYFCWFHVFEDEINHRGQMRLIVKAIPRFKNRGLLGVQLAPAMPDGTGLKFAGVASGGPAATAGLESDDVVLEYNGQATEGVSIDEFDLVAEAGTPAHFKVRREGVAELLEFTVIRQSRN